jgi:hypothetical protein
MGYTWGTHKGGDTLLHVKLFEFFPGASLIPQSGGKRCVCVCVCVCVYIYRRKGASAYVSIRQHTSAYVNIRFFLVTSSGEDAPRSVAWVPWASTRSCRRLVRLSQAGGQLLQRACVCSIRKHTSAYVSIR